MLEKANKVGYKRLRMRHLNVVVASVNVQRIKRALAP
jgi:hypothetical protein